MTISVDSLVYVKNTTPSNETRPNVDQNNSGNILPNRKKATGYVTTQEMENLRAKSKTPKKFAQALAEECASRKRMDCSSSGAELDLEYCESEKLFFGLFTREAEYTYRAKRGDTAASVRAMFGLKDGALLKCNSWIVDANLPFEEGRPIYFLEKDIKDKW